MRYVMARYVEYQRDQAYRVFVTDALYHGENHMQIISQKRYYEMIHPEKCDMRSGDEIAADLIKRAGLVVG